MSAFQRPAQRLLWAQTVLDDPALQLESASADASFRSYWRGHSGGPVCPVIFPESVMPSFDTVCEANLVKVKNGVENTAKEITTRFHSAAAADAAEQDFINRSKGGVPDEIDEVTLTGAPMGIAALLKAAGLAPSGSEATRLIDGGGVRIDSSVVSDKALKLGAGTYVVQVGKRKFARVTLA